MDTWTQKPVNNAIKEYYEACMTLYNPKKCLWINRVYQLS